MSSLRITIQNLRNIISGEIELPLEKGVYAITGKNGCGKSTIMSCFIMLPRI